MRVFVAFDLIETPQTPIIRSRYLAVDFHGVDPNILFFSIFVLFYFNFNFLILRNQRRTSIAQHIETNGGDPPSVPRFDGRDSLVDSRAKLNNSTL